MNNDIASGERMKSYDADIATTLKGIHHELADFKQHYLMDRGVELPKVKKLEHQLERAEYWWGVWFLVCRLYREHANCTTANDFVEKCAAIQKQREDEGKSREWKEAWGIWVEGWEGVEDDDDTGRPPLDTEDE